MPLASVSYPGNGSTLDWTVPFGYISRDHVTATINGVGTSFTWMGPTTIRISPAAPNGSVVGIRRTTPKTPLVDFADGNNMFEVPLDTLALQVIYLSQEQQDAVDALVLGGVTTLGGTAVTIVPAGNISSTNAQAAIYELDAEKAARDNGSLRGTVTLLPLSGVGSLRVTASDADFATGGGRAFIDLSGSTARMGYAHGGGGGGSLGLYSGASALTAWCSDTNRLILGGAGQTSQVWDERVAIRYSEQNVALGVHVGRSDYNSALVRLQTETAPGTGWNFLQCRTAGGAEAFSIRGDGAALEQGNRVYSGRSWIELTTPLVANNTVYNFAHGLTSRPVEYYVFLRCVQADKGWAVGDEVNITGQSTNGDTVTVGVDATNIVVAIWGAVTFANKNLAAYSAATVAAAPNHRWIIGVRYQPL